MSISPELHAEVRAPTDQPLVEPLDGQLIARTEDLFGLVTQLNAQALRWLAEIDTRGLAPDAGSPTTEAWVKARLKINHGPACRQVRLAQALQAHPTTAVALAAGTVNVDQAQVITTAIDTLPATVLPETLLAAEQVLVEQAQDLTPMGLTRAAQRLHSALDPDGPEPDDSDQPDPGYFLDLRVRDDGTVDGAFWLDPSLGLQLAALDKAIPPELQRYMAERANATIVEVAASHVSFVSQPEAATRLILQAVEATAAAD